MGSRDLQIKAPLGPEMLANAGRPKPYLIILLYHHKTFNGPHYRLTISTEIPTSAKRCSLKPVLPQTSAKPVLKGAPLTSADTLTLPVIIGKKIGPLLSSPSLSPET